ncbi:MULTISPECIES: dTDP-4-dehydrorhamnose 3,5-epimerase [Croceibacter]|uniref:dTDP-4-dehydrorhamnose 3,5-epimerase n=1 Tax=Croceibacter TaxID=216431 RepID=UPI000C3B2838|nr:MULTISPECIES: dTDP-4-dehydrorhamnose 3,5-epimerase [Croceibacter]MBG24865.1 dTDP-4-dehydrorhamnose 3,5-epimerase [Croceibacter sp.]|tara:strand:+ start:3313 stop:3861 length:549 start_codon:yes stop_codon:yes gene_type:complete
MIINKTPLKDCYSIEPRVFHDERGYFYEQFNEQIFQAETKLNVKFVQDNVSESKFGVIRGLHYQQGIHSQAKLVTVLEGEVLDVAIDLRKNSPSFGKQFSMILSSENKKQLFVPKGFAHGFSVLSKTARFFYKCDEYYNKESETGIKYNDETLNIDWQLKDGEIIVNDKDKHLPGFKSAIYF